MKRTIRIWLLFAAFVAGGCEKAGSGIGEHVLIRVGNRDCTVADFNRAFDIAKLAYGEEALSEPETLVEIRTRLLREVTEELIVLERAEELGLTISESELSAAVAEIKKDYPEDSFERFLLENAISFSYWKESLGRKLLAERVEAVDLEKGVLVDAGEIKKFHDAYLADSTAEPKSQEDAAAFSRQIVDRLRKEKAREKYAEWIKSLHEKYRVEINRDAWTAILGGINKRSEK